MAVIVFRCYVCGKSMKIGTENVGRKTKCLGCGTILTIPAANTPVAVAAPTRKPPAAPVMPQAGQPAPQLKTTTPPPLPESVAVAAKFRESLGNRDFDDGAVYPVSAEYVEDN